LLTIGSEPETTTITAKYHTSILSSSSTWWCWGGAVEIGAQRVQGRTLFRCAVPAQQMRRRRVEELADYPRKTSRRTWFGGDTI